MISLQPRIGGRPSARQPSCQARQTSSRASAVTTKEPRVAQCETVKVSSTTAAVFTEVGEPQRVLELELEPPRRGEVLVRLLASGVCHSDLSYIDGTWPIPLPIVLGHEGCAVIEEVGEGVDPARVGDRVVLTFSPPCGHCRFCLEGRSNLCATAAAGLDGGHLGDGTTRLRLDGAPVHHLAFVSSFARHAIVPLAGTVPITDELDPALACLLGCGVTTGVMSVTRRANVRPAESVLIMGRGGIGRARRTALCGYRAPAPRRSPTGRRCPPSRTPRCRCRAAAPRRGRSSDRRPA